MDPRAMPTVLRLRAGTKLRELRISAGVSPEEAAELLGCHKSRISRLETDIRALPVHEVEKLLTLYGLDGHHPVRRGLLQDVADSQVPQWWHAYRSLLLPAEQYYIGLESDAWEIRIWVPYVLPEILQTDAYADALTLGEQGETPQRRSFRQTRQAQVREQGQGRRLWIVIDEAVLCRTVGNADVMREQCDELIRAAKEPGVTIQVAPLSAGACPGADSPFTVLRFADPAMKDIACTPVRGTTGCTSKKEDVDAWRLVADRLVAAAEPPAKTADIVKGIWGPSGRDAPPLSADG